jgi:hypothetical protein
MIGAGDIAKQKWDEIYTLGKAPVSEMAAVCEQLEALQKQGSLLPGDCHCQSVG